jgi:predicted nucleotidyltransferase
MDFASFLIERAGNENIKNIILFGSASRDEASIESDIDLFIDLVGNKTKIEKEISKIKTDFFKSLKYEKYWLLKGIKNEINLTIGNLDEWKELKNSIISDGIILYGKFQKMPSGAIHKTLFSFENIKPESKRVLLSKRLFGYKKGDKNYEGMVTKYNAEKIGKGILVVDIGYTNVFLKLFKDMKISVKIKNIVEYS